MPTIDDLQAQPASGLGHIDALLNAGPGWNFMTPGNNTIAYTFSTAAGTQAPTGAELTYSGSLSIFDASQQQATRNAFAYIQQLTGIKFVETQDGNAAQLHFANANVVGANYSGYASFPGETYSYNQTTREITAYEPDAYVYLDNVEWAHQNAGLTAGSWGYQTLLHEIGHALGLKHPHEGTIQLPDSEDNTSKTLMSYKGQGGPYSTFMEYDIAALNFLYGGDGLLGALGVGGGGRYLTGTTHIDILSGSAGNDLFNGGLDNDVISGGAGSDTALFSGLSTAYQFAVDASGRLEVTGADGADWLDGIELLQFGDRTLTYAQAAELAPPAAPTVSVTKNAAGYVAGNTPVISGAAEANAIVKVYHGATLLGSVTASASGAWSLKAPALADGGYTVSATATDSAGIVSPPSTASFLVDTLAPVQPSGLLSGGIQLGNNATFLGTAEANATVELVNISGGSRTVLATATADSAGGWSVGPTVLVNDPYAVSIETRDAAGNLSTSATTIDFTVNSNLNIQGTANQDLLTGTTANNGIDGGGGIDMVRYSGERIAFSVQKTGDGFTVGGAFSGTDMLVDVERIEFNDGATRSWLALDIDGNGGQAYRMFEAALNRAPKAAGVGFWINALDTGTTLEKIAYDFMQVPEFVGKYGAQGANLSNEDFVVLLFNNVLGRDPKPAGKAFWTGALESGVSRAHVLMQMSESPENQAQVIGTIQNGFEYTLWQG